MEWLILLASVLVAAGLGGFITYRLFRQRLFAVQEFDKSIAMKNEQLREENKILEENNQDLFNQNDYLKSEKIKLDIQNQSAKEQLESLNGSISAMEKQAQEAAELFYASRMQAAQERLAQSLQEENQKYQDNIIGFQTEYEQTVADMLETFQELSNNVAVMRATNDAAVAAAKRAAEMKDQQAFYRIQLTDADVHEIELLRQVEPYLRDKEPLNKVIWKCYYEKPTTDLIGRVIGTGVKTGIYKITEIETGKCYIGQAANLADRWKQHIKRGVGAETPTRNKLYPAMIAAGPENFTFEVVEICDRTALDAREDYWQDYFKAKEFGYSIK